MLQIEVWLGGKKGFHLCNRALCQGLFVEFSHTLDKFSMTFHVLLGKPPVALFPMHTKTGVGQGCPGPPIYWDQQTKINFDPDHKNL